MESRPDPADNVRAPDSGSRGRFYAYTIAAVGAVLAAIVLAVVLLWPEGTSGQNPRHGTGSYGFILFARFHAIVLVDPGVAGANSVEIEIARHVEAPPGVSAVEVTVVNPSDGTSLGEFDAQPVQGSPGTFKVSNLTIPAPADWQFALRVSEKEKETVGPATLITIGAPSGAG